MNHNVGGRRRAVRRHKRQGLMDTDPVIKEISQSNHLLMVKISKILAPAVNNTRNYVFCPYAMNVNLNLLRSAAADATSVQLCRGLSMPGTVTKELANAAHKTILDGFNEILPIVLAPRGDVNKPGFIFRTKMVVPLRFRPLLDQFLQTATNMYHCDVEFLDLTNPHEVVELNDRVFLETNGLVQNLLLPDEFVNVGNRAMGITIVSYAYFKSLWEGHNSFRQEDTRRAEFTLLNDDKVQVDMMRRKRMYCSYCSSFVLRSTCCAMYFEGGRFAMMIFIPRHFPRTYAEDIRNLETAFMQTNTLEQIATQFMRYHRRSRRGDGGFLIDVHMPKFEIKADLTMTNMLNSHGVRNVFNQNTAQLHGIRGITAGDQNPYVSHILHRVHTKVDEEAAPLNPNVPTYPHPRAASECRIKVKKLNLNRPFVFTIFDYINNVTVFMGTVYNPNDRVQPLFRRT